MLRPSCALVGEKLRDISYHLKMLRRLKAVKFCLDQGINIQRCLHISLIYYPGVSGDMLCRISWEILTADV